MAVDHKQERERLREIFETLKSQEKVRFNRDFLGFTGMNEGDISSLLNPNSKRDISLPVRYYEPLIKVYGINREYLESGILPMFKPDQTELLSAILAELKEIRKLLKR